MPAATAELGLPGRRVPAVVLRASHPRREWLGPPREGSKTGSAATVTVTASVLVAVVAFAGDAAW